MTDQKELASLEAGDEFEDFPVEQWQSTEVVDDTQLWEEDWEDDDNDTDDFAQQLKGALENSDYVALEPYANLSEGPKFTAGVLMSTEACVATNGQVYISSEQHIARTGYCEYFALFSLGDRTSGHGGIVHGGLLATLLDESLCRCGFTMLPHKVGVTASLNIQYKAPTPTNSNVLLYGKTIEHEGRKVKVQGQTFVLADDFSSDLSELGPTMEAELLAVEPRWYEKLLAGAAVRAEQQRVELSKSA